VTNTIQEDEVGFFARDHLDRVAAAARFTCHLHVRVDAQEPANLPPGRAFIVHY
jgi:hypothetical protein